MRVKPVRHVQVFRGRDGGWRWRVRAANWRTMATSGQAFADLYGAVAAAHRNFPDLPTRIRHRPLRRR